ncbi:hypothetical protein ACMHYB_50275 [Sorangium sp. So ce1128]
MRIEREQRLDDAVLAGAALVRVERVFEESGKGSRELGHDLAPISRNPSR